MEYKQKLQNLCAERDNYRGLYENNANEMKKCNSKMLKQE